MTIWGGDRRILREDWQRCGWTSAPANMMTRWRSLTHQRWGDGIKKRAGRNWFSHFWRRLCRTVAGAFAPLPAGAVTGEPGRAFCQTLRRSGLSPAWSSVTSHWLPIARSVFQAVVPRPFGLRHSPPCANGVALRVVRDLCWGTTIEFSRTPCSITARTYMPGQEVALGVRNTARRVTAGPGIDSRLPRKQSLPSSGPFPRRCRDQFDRSGRRRLRPDPCRLPSRASFARISVLVCCVTSTLIGSSCCTVASAVRLIGRDECALRYRRLLMRPAIPAKRCAIGEVDACRFDRRPWLLATSARPGAASARHRPPVG